MSKHLKRWSLIAGAASIAALAVGAAAPGAASASLPEFWECTKVPNKVSAYNDSHCSEPNAEHKGPYEFRPVTHECFKTAKVEGHFTGAWEDEACTVPNAAHEGRYELKEGIAKGKEFGGSTGLSSRLLTISVEHLTGQPFECLGTKITGLVTGAKTMANVVLTFTECGIVNRSYKCGSAGKLSTLETVPLSGTVSSTESGPVVTLEAASGHLTEFTCQFIESTFRFSGPIVMHLGPRGVNEVSKELGAYFQESLEAPGGLLFEVKEGGGEWFADQAAIAGEGLTIKGENLDLKT